MTTQSKDFCDHIVELIKNNWAVDAIYLYGSRASGKARNDSDWDIAVLCQDFIVNHIDRHLRPQNIEAFIEAELRSYGLISIVDLEIVPPPLQFNIIKSQRLYDRNVPHVKHVEHAIISAIEKDYPHAA